MPHSRKHRWTARTLAIPFAVSLALHGLLFLALGFWPTPKHTPTLTIESTRITVDTCVFDPSFAALGPERELPADVIPAHVANDFVSQLHEAPPIPQVSPAEAGPTLVQESSPHPAKGATESSSQGTDAPDSGSGGGGLFPLPAKATSIVYVLDRSVSMGMDHKLDFARRELIASLRRLPASARFQVIHYNDFAEALNVDGCRDLLPAELPTVDKVVAFLQTLDAAGNTNHFAALRLALDLHPDAIYFLTDADDLKPQEVALLTQRNRHSIVHTLELTRRRSEQSQGPLAQLAHDNNGTYRRVWMGD